MSKYGAVFSGCAPYRYRYDKSYEQSYYVVKTGSQWKPYLDGRRIGSLQVDEKSPTQCEKIALGGNPLFRQIPEWFSGRIANFKFYASALSLDAID